MCSRSRFSFSTCRKSCWDQSACLHEEKYVPVQLPAHPFVCSLALERYPIYFAAPRESQLHNRTANEWLTISESERSIYKRAGSTSFIRPGEEDNDNDSMGAFSSLLITEHLMQVILFLFLIFHVLTLLNLKKKRK